MHTLVALVVTTLACALARPSVPMDGSAHLMPVPHMMPPLRPPRGFYDTYILPHVQLPRYYGYEDSPRIERQFNEGILDKEIDMINRMNMRERLPNLYEESIPYWMHRVPRAPMLHRIEKDSHDRIVNVKSPTSEIKLDSKNKVEDKKKIEINLNKNPQAPTVNKSQKNDSIPKNEKTNNAFALTPLDPGYFDHKDEEKEKHDKVKSSSSSAMNAQMHKYFAARQIRQNPNLSRTRTLVAENLDRLRLGVSQEKSDGTEKPHHFHVLETPTADPAESLFGVALLAAVVAALAMAFIAFAIGWYTLSKKAKAAADVDYPAYGVTGPNVDTSGDRKLAQSAHMYHYQHQKQQIIAMERNGMDQRNGSVSDPESEEENEEGDYTVYECPGFATTGEMEVKNPLFQDEPTPATPGKCEVVKPQPKE